MSLTNRQLLKQLADAGGETTEYPFIELGLGGALNDFLEEGLVERIPQANDFALVKITQGGLDFLADIEASHSNKPAEIGEEQAVQSAKTRLSHTKLVVGPVQRVIYTPRNGRRSATYQVWFGYAGPPVSEEQRNRIPPADHPTVIIVNATTGKCSFLPWR